MSGKPKAAVTADTVIPDLKEHEIGQNTTLEVVDGILITRINLAADPWPSSTGKSQLLGTSGGFYRRVVHPVHGPVGVNLSVTVPLPAGTAPPVAAKAE